MQRPVKMSNETKISDKPHIYDAAVETVSACKTEKINMVYGEPVERHMHKRQIEQKVPLATPHFNVHNLSRSCTDAVQASKHDYAYRISADQKQINLPFYAMTEYSTGGFCFYIGITVFDRVTQSNRLLDPFKEYMLIIMSFFSILGMESKISTVVI